jgi:hypothetical protein
MNNDPACWCDEKDKEPVWRGYREGYLSIINRSKKYIIHEQ